ncbi:MAG: AAA family ATPase [Pseudomonadota bacterium]
MSDPAKTTYSASGAGPASLGPGGDPVDEAFEQNDGFQFEDEEEVVLDDDVYAEPAGTDWAEEEEEDFVEPPTTASLMDVEETPTPVEDTPAEFVEEYDDVYEDAEDDVYVEEPPLVDEATPYAEEDDEVFVGGPGDEADRPVPRISIQAFCETPEISTLLEHAAADRRLSKAHMTIQMGGILKAADHFGETPTPNLILVETLKRGAGLLSDLEALAQVCDPSTKVIIIGAVNDIALYRELIRQGVSEYMVRPNSPMQIIHAIGALYIDPESGPIGKTVAFVGAKGGVGSSTIAHNVSWCITEDIEGDATIVDFDLSFGTAGLNFNQDPGQGVAEALSSPERLDDVLLDRLTVKCTDRLNLFAAPAALEREYDFDQTAYESVIDIVRATTPFVVLDLPHVWTAWTKRILMTSDQVVITALPDLASLRNAKNMFDLIVNARPNDPAPLVVLNQVGAPKRPEIPVKDFAEALSTEPALVLPWDPQLFGTAANNAAMIVDVNPKHKATEGMRRLAVQVSGRELARKRSKSLFAKLLGK